MIDPIKQTKINDYNAIYFGYGIEKLMEGAGKGLAKYLLKNFGPGNRIGLFCGPGNNGGDGLVAARYLMKQAEPEVFLIPAAGQIKTKESKDNWFRFKGEKHDNVSARQIPDNFDVVVECLFGTGISGKLRVPYPSIIKKLNIIKGKKVAVDMPAPGFKAKYFVSMMFAKTPRAEVVDIGYPKWLEERIGVGEVKALNQVSNDSHKGDNGKLLVIGGSDKFHGAPLLAAGIASRIVDLVYFCSVPENNKLVSKMKARSADIITVERADVLKFVRQVDAVLVGPGLGVDDEARQLTNAIINKYPNKKTILDADSLKVLDKKLLHKNCILTPHAREFQQLFGVKASQPAAKRMAKKYGCVIVLKGQTDYVCGPSKCKLNQTGNSGMTKGGTGDVLAGLIAALATKNDLFLAASAGVFLNGLAGDRLARRFSRYYSASDLVKEIPRTLKWCEDN